MMFEKKIQIIAMSKALCPSTTCHTCPCWTVQLSWMVPASLITGLWNRLMSHLMLMAELPRTTQM